ncbi:MAG: SDR family NAD(P)-dependent oxidoreductase [Oscillospiraceae bacterium]
MGEIYLVTGAAGHLGNTVVRKLLDSGKKVRALVLANDKAAELLPKEVDVFEGNVTDKDSLRAFFDVGGSEAIVIHCAGIVSIVSKFDQRVYNVNVNGTKNIVELCLENKVKKLVHVSSVHAIPEQAPGQVMTEISDFDPEKVVGLYAKTKAEATAYVLAACDRGLNASVVHPSGISGPGDSGRGHITQLLIDYCKGTLTAGVHGGYDFVDVRDVADGVISCCERGRQKECYILANKYFSVEDLFLIFHRITGKHLIKTIIPMWFAKGTACLAEIYYKIRRQPPLYTAYSLYTLSSNSRFSSEKAQRELGYKNRPFDDTIKDTYEWLKAQNRF